MTGTVVDTSAVIAIVFKEPPADALIELLRSHRPRLMSVATRVELGMVAEGRFGSEGRDLVDDFLRDTGIEFVQVDIHSAERALAAWRRFGKGRHPAALNLGDCFAYAAAEQQALPLLCIGNDFRATDITVLGPS